MYILKLEKLEVIEILINSWNNGEVNTRGRKFKLCVVVIAEITQLSAKGKLFF